MTDVWDDSSLANPHGVSDKRRRVQRMFAAIAPSYDLNNRLHSLWMDQSWRRRAVKLAELQPADRVIDVACGTGDLTLAFYDGLQRANESLPAPAQVIGIDFTYEMLPLAVAKWTRRVESSVPCKEFPPPLVLRGRAGVGAERQLANENPHPHPPPEYQGRGNEKIIRFINGDAQALPLPNASCDVALIAFGIRNVADPAAALREFFRVLRPAGRLIILEFSLPNNPLLRGLYNFYFRHILPRTATWISGDKTGAYRYLPQSVNTFIGRETMAKMMADAGFVDVRQKPMTFGVCICYRGVKR